MASILLRGLTEEEKKEVERINREYHIELATKEGLEKGMAEGLEKGMAEGLEKGMAQGIVQGIEQGRFGSVDRLVEEGILDEARACEILGVSLDDYKKYKTMN